MKESKFKFIIKDECDNGDDGWCQGEVLTLLNISNHKAFCCEDGVGIQGLSFTQVQKALEFVYDNWSGLIVKIIPEK